MAKQRAKPPTPPGRRPRRRPAAWLTTLVTVIGSVAITALPAVPAQASPLRSTPLITYNMLGATSGQDSKWTTTIGNYIQAAEIVTL
ncbi:hypothetical protein [Streptomyces syringium]|uniref:Uncharacterized protein n=1 Tax=Streptomyces syringium TaxID=76729 RepID=A0ABS4XYB0_9ACTN|nr:hypothetical protein [Streptomyces syringium]MBP2401513.1 hypothetical protein [Streptomyces syringium]